jgi:addiction module HigA family antidote
MPQIRSPILRFRGIVSKRLKAIVKVNTVFASTISGEFALFGQKDMTGRLKLKLLTITETHMTRTAIHPGEHLAEQLEELKMSAAELARQLNVPTNRITHIINGERAVTGDTALRLAHFFGISAEFWLNLQKMYELRLAEQEVGAAIKTLPRIGNRGRKRQSTQSRAA